METVMLHISALKAVASLPPQDAVAILQAVIALAEGGTPEVPEHLRFGWSLIAGDILRDIKSYTAKCEKNRQNAKRKFEATASDGMRPQANTSERLRPYTTASDTESGSTIQYNTKQDNTIQYKRDITISNARATSAPREEPAQAQKPSGYPETAEAVIAIASAAGIKMERKDAELYLAVRSSGDWFKQGYRNRIPVGQISADIRVWMEREKNKKNNNISKDDFRDGKHLSDFTGRDAVKERDINEF